MADPFTIRIFVPDGDPEGVRLIDRMNWTGLGLVFRRSDWPEVRKRSEMQSIGIYVLVGYRSEDDDLPTLYIGQADGVRGRIELHHKDKEFWNWAAVFVSTSGDLNRAHVAWLEYALVMRVTETGRCYLDNRNAPQEPALSAAEKADTQGFMKEILQILLLVDLPAFEFPKAVAAQLTTDPLTGAQPSSGKHDTIIVPAQKDGIEETFLGEVCWYAIRISGCMLDEIKYTTAYRTQPVSAITRYAPVSCIEP
ncbi:MAG: GIY-YIG nuclease family protein [Nitrospinae bacterium]|nr:GIY-YIG nuclease family protein [Nitrospinota bacterium]